MKASTLARIWAVTGAGLYGFASSVLDLAKPYQVITQAPITLIQKIYERWKTEDAPSKREEVDAIQANLDDLLSLPHMQNVHYFYVETDVDGQVERIKVPIPIEILNLSSVKPGAVYSGQQAIDKVNELKSLAELLIG